MTALQTSEAVFAPASKLRTERFLFLLRNDVDGKIFTERFFDAVDRRRASIAKLQQTLFFLQIPIFIYLALIISGVDANVTVLGVSAGKNLREALVVTSAVFGLWSSWANNESDGLQSIIKARNHKIAKGNKDAIDFLDVGYGISPPGIVDPMDNYWTKSLIQKATLAGFALSMMLLMLMVIVLGIGLHIAALVQIHEHPNFSPFATKLIMTFVILADFVTISWRVATSGLLPYRSHERAILYAKLLETDQVRAQAIMREVVLKHRKKGFLRRHFTRAKLPRDL